MIQKNWQDLIKPNKLESSLGDDPKRIATVIAEPLERGFRPDARQRAASRAALFAAGRGVTAVQIDGVLHEFSSIPGVREDVTDIVLNIKDDRRQDAGDGPKRMVPAQAGPRCGLRRRHQT